MPRRHRVLAVGKYEPALDSWTDVDSSGAVERDHLTLCTFNIWFNDYFATERHHAIGQLLSERMPDIMVFQEVTPSALTVLLAQTWIRDNYLRAAVTDDTDDHVGNYGMLMLSRLPLNRVHYTPLPTRLARGYLTAELTINGSPQTIVAVHLESGKAASRLRTRQLGRVFHALHPVDEAIVLGDFNMRNGENHALHPAYLDLWPALRPDEDGFTEDTSINLMRLDSKNKHRQVRFDRVLLKSDEWRPVSIDLVGCEPISTELPRVFPSDHFGVHCRLHHRDAVIPRPAPRRRFGWLRRHRRRGG